MRSDYRDEGLQPATTYEYRVSAFDDDGDEGDLSDAVQVTTEASAGTHGAHRPGGYRRQSVPNRPRVVAVRGRGRESLSTGCSGTAMRSRPPTRRRTRTRAWNPRPSTNTGYRRWTGWETRAIAAIPSSATTEAEPGPPAPRDVTAVAWSSTQINLSWNPPAASAHPVQGYNVYRDEESIGFVVSTAFIDTGLTPETTYGYTVAAVDTRGVEGEMERRGVRHDGRPFGCDSAGSTHGPAVGRELRLIGS